jgi:hypothetical protein
MATIQAEVQDLRTALHKRGYDTKPNGSGHFEVYTPEGKRLVTNNGQTITIPCTPKASALRMTVALLRDKGALPPTVKGGGNKVTVRRQEQHLTRVQLKRKTTELRNDVTRLMEEHGLKQTDIYHYADYYAGQHGLPVPANPQGIVSKLLKGQSYLMNEPFKYLRAAVDAIKAANGEIPRAEEIRRMTNGHVQPKTEPKGIEVVSEDPKPLPPRVPKLAFEVMQAIYTDEKDADAILALVREIAELEVRR